MAVRLPQTQPLILLESEDIKFVEDDFSSSSEKNQHVNLVVDKTADPNIYMPVKNHNFDSIKPSEEEDAEEHYTEITAITSDTNEQKSKVMENLKPPPTPEPSSSRSSSIKSNRSSNFVLNILNRSPRVKRKPRHEYEMVLAKDEDSTYSNISVTSKGDGGGLRKKISGIIPDFKKNDPKAEEDDQVLEALRQVVRKCTNPDPMKRPTSRDLFDLVDIAFDKT